MTTTKLTREEFATAIRHGRGRALMHAMAYGLDGIDDIVLEACLESQAYDAQCEDYRAPWLYRMFNDSPYYGKIADAVLSALAMPEERNSIAELCWLAGLMGKDGNLRAATTLRDYVLGQDFAEGSTRKGAEALVMIDGLPAAIALAKRYGDVLLHDPKAYVDQLDDLTQEAGIYEQVLSALQQLAAHDTGVSAYLAAHLSDLARQAEQQAKSPEVLQDEQQQRKKDGPTVDALIAAAESGSQKWRGFYTTFGRWATSTELAKVYERLIEERDPEICLRLLRVFNSAPLPYLSDRMWELAEHADKQLRIAAIRALMDTRDAAVRAFGCRKLLAPGLAPSDLEALELFAYNYEPGDECMIMQALRSVPALTEDEVHGIGMDALAVCEHNKVPALAGLAEWIWHATPCTLCRRHAIEWLAEMDCLPPEIRNECLWDAECETRQIAGEPTATSAN